MTRAPKSTLRRMLVLVAASVAACTHTVSAQTVNEYRVKAAFLRNFANFVEWPAETFKTRDEPIAICILGEDPFGTALTEAADGGTLNGRRFTERHISGAEEARGCQILFISSS